ncbi:23S rRNA (uracil(1939)-C(5))-methyltransferase RlmD [Rickettsiella grylli]|uniref:23S rRNA (uracil(1939)-C(5))-methyltransferase RlmD n=1 Tax=Rickettsiella grylli TaxID=59196 RepID=A8PP31_9COXI|nr:23S rRNA (uracil(1939)-C(5))-methyltransferase RlmD [Rickettsiella grylli]EDP46761.1 23S rRNA (uracil-5-)-methyltransferase RumA [Rickettsiella grylli]
MEHLKKYSYKETTPIFITGISHEGRGIAHINGKITFIENALPGERVSIVYTKKRRAYDEARATQILNASTDRIQPQCPHFNQCGGCNLQHLNHQAQLQHKEKILVNQLTHVAKTKPTSLLAPVMATGWGYRRRARLGVKYVAKKQAVLVGFREKNGHYLAQIQTCKTLDFRVDRLLIPLQQLIQSLNAFHDIPQIEVALGDEILGLVFRHLVPLNNSDVLALKNFAKKYSVQLYLQPGNEKTTHCIWPENPQLLSYRLQNKAHRSLEFFFEPHHFIQINATINQAMIQHAIELLSPHFSDRILDLFCGLGNFSLPLALRCQSVVGIEGHSALVEQAKINARHNAINNTQFYTADLTGSILKEVWAQQTFNKILLDPPRSGALEVIQQIARWKVEKMVYISCNPATLARDSEELIKQGYHLERAGIMDMFPQTHHSEAICLFTQ